MTEQTTAEGAEGPRIALITGASSGIGAALARELAERGTTVGIVARREERLREILTACQKHAPESRLWVADLSDPQTAGELAVEIWDAFGRIDVLVNNAGVPMRRAVTALTMGDIERVMRTNFFSPVAISLALLPRMLQQGRGTIVNVSSVGGRMGITTEAAYSASKFALSGWSEAMAVDLDGTGIKIRLILPGAIDTEIWDQPGNDAPMYDGPLVPAEEVAQGIAEAIDSDRFEHYLPDMKPVVEMKTSDIDAFMAGMIAFTRQQRDAAPGGGAGGGAGGSGGGGQ